jgi:hypothetical protein
MSTSELISIAAIFLGPFGAVLVTEWIRRHHEMMDRKVHLFRALMSTRASTLAPSHVEALNLIDIEFDAKKAKERPVIDAWKLYHSHLNDQSYEDTEAWLKRTELLLVDLLHAMSICLGYPFDKAHIKNSSYYPKGYGEVELDQHRTRKSLVEVLEGRKALNVISHMAPQQLDQLIGAQQKIEQGRGATALPRVAHD